MELLVLLGIFAMVFIITCLQTRTEKRLEEKLSNVEKELSNVEKELRKTKKAEDFAISTMIEGERELLEKLRKAKEAEERVIDIMIKGEEKYLIDIEWLESEVSFWKEQALAHGWTEDCFEPEQYEGLEEAKHEREVMWQHGIIDEREVA